MQHEITIIVYNPTTDTDNWTADVYLKSFDPSKQDGNDVRDERVYCGKGGLSKQEAVFNATIYIQSLEEAVALARMDYPNAIKDEQDTGK